MIAQRDVFIQKLYEKAITDQDIIMISVDMGAPTLDQWKDNLPNQFIAAGISEQNAINVAAGLANSGKKVFIYFIVLFYLCFPSNIIISNSLSLIESANVCPNCSTLC